MGEPERLRHLWRARGALLSTAAISYGVTDQPGISGALVRPVLVRLQNLRPHLEAAVKVMRGVVLEEFDQRAWFTPSGGVEPWPAVAPFGSRRLGPQPLIQTGVYAAALQGIGSGAIKIVTDNSATIGASGSVFPYAQALRTGAVIKPLALTRGKRSWTGPQRFAMWWRLFYEYGVTLSEARLLAGLVIPARMHLTDSPLLRQRLLAAARSWVVAGRPEAFA